MSEKGELKPCPFCGFRAYARRTMVVFDEEAVYEVYCGRCRATIVGRKRVAFARWNRRKP